MAGDGTLLGDVTLTLKVRQQGLEEGPSMLTGNRGLEQDQAETTLSLPWVPTAAHSLCCLPYVSESPQREKGWLAFVLGDTLLIKMEIM